MKGDTWSDDYIAYLNANTRGGVFLKAAILDDPIQGLRYFVSSERALTFDGQIYIPLTMSWRGVSLNTQMELPTVSVVVPSVSGVIEAYLEDLGVSLIGRNVRLRIFHLNLLGNASDVDDILMQVMAIGGHLGLYTFTLGLNIALGEMLPRHVISSSEFPGIPNRMRRASIL